MKSDPIIIHLIDGTYELYRHFYGQRSFNNGKDKPFGAMVGVLNSILQMIEEGATHIGVATDHVIESFRNDLWAEYKTGEGIERALWKQFHPLEEALKVMGITVGPMIELEADDALASAAHLASKDSRVAKVCIWTPDKDLAQCVKGDEIVQVDRRAKIIRNEEGVRKKFGVSPQLIPDYLALVGDSADGYPGIPGIGKTTAASLLNEFGPIESFPKNILEGHSKNARLFKKLATLKTNAKLFKNIDELNWQGCTPEFEKLTKKINEPKLLTRAKKLFELTSS